MRDFAITVPSLQNRHWPHVPQFHGFCHELNFLLDLPVAAQREYLARLRSKDRVYGRFLHRALGDVFAFRFGYDDSPCVGGTNDDLEMRLEQTKIVLERELLDRFLDVPRTPSPMTQRELGPLMRELAMQNPGVSHPLFDYLAEEATADKLRQFLWDEVIRNEVVDDEVALLTAGLQGLPKQAASINLFDECGRGKLQHFHTYWLRSLVESLAGWDELLTYRTTKRPWCASIGSNTFSTLLTRPSYQWAAYGHFLITEAWVAPHFEKILSALSRTGLAIDDIYFSAHATLDPTHAEEMIVALEIQQPFLTPWQCHQIAWGGRVAIAAGVQQFNRLLAHFRSV